MKATSHATLLLSWVFFCLSLVPSGGAASVPGGLPCIAANGTALAAGFQALDVAALDPGVVVELDAGCYRLVISKKWVPAQSGTFILRGAGAETALDLEWGVSLIEPQKGVVLRFESLLLLRATMLDTQPGVPVLVDLGAGGTLSADNVTAFPPCLMLQRYKQQLQFDGVNLTEVGDDILIQATSSSPGYDLTDVKLSCGSGSFLDSEPSQVSIALYEGKDMLQALLTVGTLGEVFPEVHSHLNFEADVSLQTLTWPTDNLPAVVSHVNFKGTWVEQYTRNSILDLACLEEILIVNKTTAEITLENVVVTNLFMIDWDEWTKDMLKMPVLFSSILFQGFKIDRRIPRLLIKNCTLVMSNFEILLLSYWSAIKMSPSPSMSKAAPWVELTDIDVDAQTTHQGAVFLIKRLIGTGTQLEDVELASVYPAGSTTPRLDFNKIEPWPLDQIESPISIISSGADLKAAMLLTEKDEIIVSLAGIDLPRLLSVRADILHVVPEGTATQGLLGKVVWPKEGVTLYNGVVLGTRLAQEPLSTLHLGEVPVFVTHHDNQPKLPFIIQRLRIDLIPTFVPPASNQTQSNTILAGLSSQISRRLQQLTSHVGSRGNSISDSINNSWGARQLAHARGRLLRQEGDSDGSGGEAPVSTKAVRGPGRGGGKPDEEWPAFFLWMFQWGSDDTMLYVDFCKIVLTPPEFEQVHATAVLGADWKSGGGRFAALMEEFQVNELNDTYVLIDSFKGQGMQGTTVTVTRGPCPGGLELAEGNQCKRSSAAPIGGPSQEAGSSGTDRDTVIALAVAIPVGVVVLATGIFLVWLFAVHRRRPPAYLLLHAQKAHLPNSRSSSEEIQDRLAWGASAGGGDLKGPFSRPYLSAPKETTMPISGVSGLHNSFLYKTADPAVLEYPKQQQPEGPITFESTTTQDSQGPNTTDSEHTPQRPATTPGLVTIQEPQTPHSPARPHSSTAVLCSAGSGGKKVSLDNTSPPKSHASSPPLIPVHSACASAANTHAASTLATTNAGSPAAAPSPSQLQGNNNTALQHPQLSALTSGPRSRIDVSLFLRSAPAVQGNEASPPPQQQGGQAALSKLFGLSHGVPEPLLQIQQLVNTMKQKSVDEGDQIVILHPIGQGGYGTVYKGMWRSLEVAVKMVLFQAKAYTSTPPPASRTSSTPKSLSASKSRNSPQSNGTISFLPGIPARDGQQQQQLPQPTEPWFAGAQNRSSPEHVDVEMTAAGGSTQGSPVAGAAADQAGEQGAKRAAQEHMHQMTQKRMDVEECQGQQRAVLEAAVTSSIAHPNVVATYHYDITAVKDEETHGLRGMSISNSLQLDWKLYLVQEFCDGGSLAEALDRRVFHSPAGIPYLDSVLCVLIDVARGMSHIHTMDVIHGDLAPGNVLLKHDISRPNMMIAKIADFGLCSTLNPGMTHVSNVCNGTPYYMAPEAIQTSRSTTAADVYSMGVLMWEMFTGHVPWDRTNSRRFVLSPNYKKFPPGTPSSYMRLAQQCMHSNPKLRPSFEVCFSQLEKLYTKLMHKAIKQQQQQLQLQQPPQLPQ